MRMAEMRKGGLRGGALRHSGLKALEGSDLKLSKGKKGLAGKGFKRMAAIPECCEAVDVPLEGLGGEESAGGVGGFAGGDEVAMTEEGEYRLEAVESSLKDKVFDELTEGAGVEEESLMSAKENTEVSECNKGAPCLAMIESGVAVTEMDSVLDLCEAQPLQNMSFLLSNENLEVRKSPGKMVPGDGGSKMGEDERGKSA